MSNVRPAMKWLILFALIVPHLAVGRPTALLAEEAYFECPTSRSLQGGIFGKGPIRRFGPSPASCSGSEWQRISREDFKAKATQWYGKNWEVEIPFFKNASGAAQK
jgi:hypothetical protein